RVPRQPPQAGAVGVDHVDLVLAAAGWHARRTAAKGPLAEHDLPSVRRPLGCRPRIAGQPSQAASVGIDDVELEQVWRSGTIEGRPATAEKRDPRCPHMPARADPGRDRRRRGLRRSTAIEKGEDANAYESHEYCDRPVPATATTVPAPRLLDQRLDEGLDLVAFERLAAGSRALRRGQTRRGGDGHASHRFTNELVLLVH